MTRFSALMTFLLTASVASAQLPQISLTGVYPPGAQAGSSVAITISGTDLDDTAELLFSAPGISAAQRKDGNGKPVANQFDVTVGPNVAPGLYDVRALGLYGVSNPRILRIDSLPEVNETEPNNSPEQAQTIAMDHVVNARSNGQSDVDFFWITAAAGQTIVARAEAAIIDSKMQPALSVYNADGKRVARARRRREHDGVIVFTSPVAQKLILRVHDVVFAGGTGYEYRLCVDTRPVVDFVQPPIVSASKPTTVTIYGRNIPGGEPTSQSVDGTVVLRKDLPVTLPDHTVGMPARNGSAPLRHFAGVPGNILTFATGEAPAVKENTTTDEPQMFTPPAAISGGFERRKDEDIYRFTAKKGDVWQLDLFADRISSEAAPLLIVERVTVSDSGDETLQRLARVDSGHPAPGGNDLPTATVDPLWKLNVPEDGTYQLRLQDRYSTSRGSAALHYTAVVSKPVPEFRVVLFDSRPSADGKAPTNSGAVSIRRGGKYQIPCYAFRSGGHNDEILVMPRNLPNGITAPPARILPGKTSGVLVFTAAADAAIEDHRIEFVAVSGPDLPGQPTAEQLKTAQAGTVQAATLAHTGVNGLSRHGRTAAAVVVSIMRDEEPVAIDYDIASTDLSQDQQMLIPIKLQRRAGFVEKVDIQFTGLPKNVDIPKVSIAKGQDSALAKVFVKENAPPGETVLQLYATATVPYRKKPWLVDEAKAGASKVTAELAAAKTEVDKAGKAVAEAEKMLTLAAAETQKAEQALKLRQSEHTQKKQELAVLFKKRGEAATALTSLQNQLTAATKSGTADLDAAVSAVADATKTLSTATEKLKQFSKTVESSTQGVSAAAAALSATQKTLAATKSKVQERQAAIEKAKAKVVAATNAVKAKEAAKKSADEAVKAAESKAKPQNKKVRVTGLPVPLRISTTPGKIAAAVPGGGAIKKAAAIDIPVTLTRKNKFAGPVSLKLFPPPGESRISSNVVTIAADQTKGIIRVSATGDAAAGDIANCVIRASAEFNGRQAAFDAPISLKVVE